MSLEKDRLVDIVIPIAPNDFKSLVFSLPYIKRFLPCKQIVVIANASIREKVEALDCIGFIDEDELYDGLTFANVSRLISEIYPKAVRRAGWYFQQFLKLAYAWRCKGDCYLTWDSDTIPVKDINLFSSDGRPYLDYLPVPYGDSGYFDFLQHLRDGNFRRLDKEKSFITEHMFFSTQMVKRMLVDIETNRYICGESFFERILRAIDKKQLNLSGFSEFETYAAYVQCVAPTYYVKRRWNNLRNGKFYIGKAPTESKLKWVAERFDVVSLEDYDNYFCLNRFVSILRKNLPFALWYNIMNPCYELYYRLRLVARTIIKR